jgi:hypothetical protein
MAAPPQPRPRRGRRRPPLLVLLALAAAAAHALDTRPGSVQHLAAQAPAGVAAAPGQKPDVGTVDAPIDGLDGKPHAGPFVETTKKKPAQLVEDLGAAAAAEGAALGAERASAPAGRGAPPEDDGVMSDVAGRREVSGPTGTEGGVSAKEFERKEAAGGKKAPPEPPREPPKMPDGAASKAVDGEAKEGKEEEKKKKGAAGLAVSDCRCKVGES